MKDAKKDKSNICKELRERFVLKFFSESSRLGRHIAQCPRCQKRLMGYSRVELALELMRCQGHSADLLKRANSHAIGVLRHSLREKPQAEGLKEIKVRPGWFECRSGFLHALGGAAACMGVVILMKIGVFTSIDRVKTTGDKAVRYYCVRQMGEEMTEDFLA